MLDSARLCTALTLACTLFISGCSGQGPEVGPAEMALVGRAVDKSLNTPILAIHANVVRSKRDEALWPQELQIAGPEGSAPTDWWLYDAGFLKIGGSEGYQAYFALTPEGEAFAAAPAPKLLKATFKAPPEVTCSGSRRAGICHVTGTADVAVTEAGSRLLRGPQAIAAQPFALDLELTQQGWRATDIILANGGDLQAMAHVATFGDAAAAQASRSLYATKVNRLAQ